MTLTEDDFGIIRPSWAGRGKADGACPPRNSIGLTLADVKPEPEIRPREPDQCRPNLGTSTVYALEDMSSRRLKRSVFDQGGKALTKQRPSSGNGRPEGIKRIDYMPEKQRAPHETTKRCFGWTHRPTGYENPDTYEEPVEPGVRPSHPVCAIGPVATDRKRAFHAQIQSTGIPPPRMSKAPHGSDWGGWGVNGAPGRKPLQSPWDSLQKKDPSSDEADYRFCDARTRRYPEMKYQDTFHLTRWHWDAQHDIDPIGAKRIHLNTPTASTVGTAAGQRMAQVPAAGKKSNMPVEGAALPWYERIREQELKAPMTAR